MSPIHAPSRMAILHERAAHRFAAPSPLVELPIAFGELTTALSLVCARSAGARR